MFTAYLSLTSAGSIPDLNVWNIAGWDKWGHLIFYLIFTFSGLMGYARQSGKNIKMVIFFIICFGVLMEFFQLYMSKGRLFEYNDVIANIAGVVVGYILFKKFIN
jgi:VanZ family protein